MFKRNKQKQLKEMHYEISEIKKAESEAAKELEEASDRVKKLICENHFHLLLYKAVGGGQKGGKANHAS